MAVEPETCYRHPNEETRIHCARCGRPICPECMHPAPVGHHCPTCVGEARRAVRLPRSIPRPRSLTAVILAANVGVFLVEVLLGGATNLLVLRRLGAMVPERIADGEYWRLLTAMFLHVGVFHLLLNSYALYLFGTIVEGTLGTLRFAAVYFVSGFVASATSYAFGAPMRVAAGASGAIFGLLGAWLAYNWRRRSLSMAQWNMRTALFLVVINVLFGLTFRGIDNAAHLGGLVAGVMAGLAAEGAGRRRVRQATRVMGFALLAAAGVLLVAVRTAALS